MLTTHDDIRIVRHEVPDVVASSGRERAAKVAAAAATVAHGWDRLRDTELQRLHTALADHAASYVDWLGGVTGPGTEHVHELRSVVSTIVTVNDLLWQSADPAVCRRLAEMLGRAAHNLVVTVDEAGRASVA